MQNKAEWCSITRIWEYCCDWWDYHQSIFFMLILFRMLQHATSGELLIYISVPFFFFCILLILCGNLLLINGPWKYWWHHRFLGFSQVLIQTEAFLPAGRRKMHRSSTNLSLEYFSTSGSNKTHNLLLWLRCVVQLCLSAL